MIVEAAALVPVFLFASVLLVYIVQILHFQEIIHFEASKELVSMSWESCFTDSGMSELSYNAALNYNTGQRIDKGINISTSVEDEEEVYTVDMRYPIELDLPFGLFDDITIRDNLAARKWTGKEDSGDVQGFAAMENDDSDSYVYIFPKYGEKYHKSGCFYLERDDGYYSECVSASEAAAKGYSKCAVCG